MSILFELFAEGYDLGFKSIEGKEYLESRNTAINKALDKLSEIDKKNEIKVHY